MVRSLTFALATVGAAAILYAQAPAPDQPAGDRPGAQAPAAQQPATPAPRPSAEPSQKPSAPMSSAADKVTWSGCVKPGTTPGSWILENAQAGTAAGATSPVGTAGAASKTTLNLTLKPGDDLKAHANHKIEVTGMLAPGNSSSATASTPGATTTATASTRTFTVDSFKMVSATCP